MTRYARKYAAHPADQQKEAFEFISDRIGLPVLFSSLIFLVLLLPASFFCCHKAISVGRDRYSKMRILWISMICILSIISIHKYIPSLFLFHKLMALSTIYMKCGGSAKSMNKI